MQTFLRENKGKLTLLLILTLCMIVLRTNNIYQAWYYLTPWEDLGRPPDLAQRILKVGFSGDASRETIPSVYVSNRHENIYRCCSAGGWEQVSSSIYFYPWAAFLEGQKEEPGTPYLGNEIEQEWNIQQEVGQGILESAWFGFCISADSCEYVIVQLKQDGTVREKYIDGKEITELRTRLSTFFAVLSGISILILAVTFVRRNWQRMKMRWQENKLGWLVLGVPLLGLAILWSVNVYKVWYDNTPWVKIASPPSKVTKIHYVSFPYTTNGLPEIEAYAEDRKVYHLNGMGKWNSGHYPDYLELSHFKGNAISPQESVCVTKIRNEWQLDDEQDQNAYLIYTRGSCPFYTDMNYEYVVYKFMNDGNVFGKYLTDEKPNEFRQWATFFLCLFLGLSSPIWIYLFVDFDFLKLKPDHRAG